MDLYHPVSGTIVAPFALLREGSSGPGSRTAAMKNRAFYVLRPSAWNGLPCELLLFTK